MDENTTDRAESLIRVFDPRNYRTEGAYFWDGLREDLPAWKELEYVWIASSCFGDQVILTMNSPIHPGRQAVYVHGPDVSGPNSEDPNWLDNILYLGSSVEEWLARVRRFGDEHSVEPGDLEQRLRDADEYRRICRELNPGLPW